MRRLLAVLLLPSLLTVSAAAQSLPLRPELPKGSDANDWQDYYSFGVDVILRSSTKADAAFYWATRLDPTRAEPIYGQWIAFWMNDISEFPDYLDGSPRVLADPTIIASDSIRYRAWERNPMVNQALLVLLYKKLGGSLRDSPGNRGWIAYANGFYPQALDGFSAALRGDSSKIWLRYDLALVYSQIGRYDSAVSQITQLVAAMDRLDRKRLVYSYESKEMYEYALGLLNAARGHIGAAREAQERALQENLAFAPAHAALGQLAAARRDKDGAVTEYGLAVELAPRDAVMRRSYADALLRTDQAKEALAHAKQVVQLEPYWADAYVTLGDVDAALHDTTSAVAAYNEYIKRAPQRSAEQIATVKDRLAQLAPIAKSP